MIIPQRRTGTWGGVPVATWSTECICHGRKRGVLVPHVINKPASSCLPLLRGAAVSRTLTISRCEWVYTRIFSIFSSPNFPASSTRSSLFKPCEANILSPLQTARMLTRNFRLPAVKKIVKGKVLFLIFNSHAATQLALQLHQERMQVVCSNREAQKRPARGHSRHVPWT